MNVIKLILTNYPKPVKYGLRVITIGGMLAHLISQFLSEQPFYFGTNFWILIIVIAMGSIAGFLSASIRTVSILSQTNKQTKSHQHQKDRKRRKQLPDELKIDEEIDGKFLWDIKFQRRFLPFDKPGIDRFEGTLVITSMMCSLCRLEIEQIKIHTVNRGTIFVYKCNNPNCKNYNLAPMVEGDFTKYNEKIEKKVKSEIRSNYDDVWAKYVQEYDRLTDKNYDDYALP